MERHTYNLTVKWNEGRKGMISSPELPLKFEVATPPEFDQGVPDIWSPEHLFTASVLSCYMTTFLAISEYSKLAYEAFDCNAEGVLEKVEGKYLMTEINLFATLKIKDMEDEKKAERVLQKSEKACLISNSIKSKVNLSTNIIGK
jgi:peroxiredoxin-like protein